MSQAHILYALLAITAGIAVPILATINGSFAQTIGNTNFASLLLVSVSVIAVTVVLLATRTSLPDMETLRKASWWHFTAGLFIAYYVVTITFVAPRFGVGNAIIFVVAAQIFTAVTIDHFGLFGAAIQEINLKRIAGILFLVIGVALAKS